MYFFFIVDFESYVKIINRPDGFKPLGQPEDYIRGFQVFDKEATGFIGVGELRYILTSIGEKLTDAEVDELLKGVNVSKDGNVNYIGMFTFFFFFCILVKLLLTFWIFWTLN